MNIWNTIATAKEKSALDEAISALQTLSDVQNIPILDFLQEHHEASLLDLSVATGQPTATLEKRLDLLCKTQIVRKYNNGYGNYYRFNRGRVIRITAIAGKLVKGNK